MIWFQSELGATVYLRTATNMGTNENANIKKDGVFVKDWLQQ